MTIASRYRTRVNVQQPTPSADAVGQRVPTWSTVATRLGDLVQRQGRETEGAAILSVTQWELRLRYESAIASLTPEWRITTATQTFDVQSVINVGQLNREFLLILSEVV